MEKDVGAYRIYFFIATRASYLCLVVSTPNELLSTHIGVLFSIKWHVPCSYIEFSVSPCAVVTDVASPGSGYQYHYHTATFFSVYYRRGVFVELIF